MSPTTLLIGSGGQLGKELHQLQLNRNIIAVNRQQLDLTQPAAIRDIINKIQPQIIINTAAYTAVDRAESESELANAVNAIAPGIIAQAAQKLGALFIHLSTDYVFDGRQSHPYTENDATNPINVYGTSKLAGEHAIQNNCDNYLILRTAWVYSSHGNNFVKTMLKLGAQQQEIRVVADQIGSPTWTHDLADAIAQLQQFHHCGIYHYTNSGVASWYDFAVAIFEHARQLDFPLKVQRVIPITTAEYPTPAQRPAYSVLACAKITATLKTIPPHWQQQLKQCLTAVYYESADSLRR